MLGPVVADSAPASLLREALAQMSFRVEPGRFALLGFSGPPDAKDFEAVLEAPSQLIVEDDEVTVLVRESRASGIGQRHPTAPA